MLLVDALSMCCIASQIVGCRLVDVISKTRARPFYIKYGFHPLLDDQMHLYMPIETAEKAVASLKTPENAIDKKLETPSSDSPAGDI